MENLSNQIANQIAKETRNLFELKLASDKSLTEEQKNQYRDEFNFLLENPTDEMRLVALEGKMNALIDWVTSELEPGLKQINERLERLEGRQR